VKKDKNKRVPADDYLTDIFSPVREELAALEISCQEILKSDEEIFSRLCNYVLSSGGKKIRPALIFLCAKASAGRLLYPEDSRILIKLAAVVELIHTATLVHDDIIDNAELRRKNPSINAVWGEEYSLLFGDYLFSQAFSLLSEVEIPQINARVSATCKLMCEGEVRQLRLRRSLDLSEEQYLRIIKDKTACLMSTAAWLGAYVAEAKEEIKEALSNFGLNFGLAFQIVDDCLDIMGDEHKEGKSLGRDIETGKFTLPFVYLFSFLPPEERKRISNFFADAKKNTPRIKTLAFSYRAVELALKKSKSFLDKAKEEIASLPKTEAKESLIALSDFILERLAT
jgi:octaprenyl-diphosphate synthase